VFARQIDELASQAAQHILNIFLSHEIIARPVIYDGDDLVGDFTNEFSHRGIYGFRVEKNGEAAIAYIGKAENDGRLRQHLCCQNKNGSQLSDNTRTKYVRIRESIKKGFSVDLCLYSDPDFTKASLGGIEIAALEQAREQFKAIFPEESPWIARIG
jgi:hypothetical protein